MPRRAMLLGAIAVLGLPGCDRQPAVDLTNASLDEVVGQQAAAVTMRPGLWEVTVETLAPAAATAGRPKSAVMTTRTCLTASQVERPTAMLGGGIMQAFKDRCRYDRFHMKGGRIDAAMHCAMPDGQKIATTTRGTFTATTLAMESESDIGGSAGGRPLSTRIRMAGRRVDACPAGGS